MIQLNRRISTVSKIHRNIYRLVLKLNTGARDEFWVEKQEMSENKEKVFVMDSNFFKQAQKFHPLLSIDSVESKNGEESKTSGKVFIYYYPKGLYQELALQIVRPDNQGRWTLYLDPVLKEFQLLEQEKSLKQIRDSL